MITEGNIILDTVQINQKIRRIAYQIYESNSNEKEVIIAGIIGATIAASASATLGNTIILFVPRFPDGW